MLTKVKPSISATLVFALSPLHNIDDLFIEKRAAAMSQYAQIGDPSNPGFMNDFLTGREDSG